MEADSFLNQLPEHLNVMQIRSFIAVLTFILLGIMSFTNNTDAAGKSNQRGNLVHMVSFKFKESVTKDDIKKVETAFAGLQKKIPQILSYETGTNNSPEGLDKGFTHGFVLTFHSGQDRDDYLIHPHHKDFGKLVGPLLEDVFVLDFWNGQ
jgi:hypothetical protein